MNAKAQAPDSKRRLPKRANARETVAAIFEATARILEADGREGLNTNRIAELAGVSIGSLYAYFPNKQAILLAMARRELGALRDRVIAAITDPAAQDVPPERRAIRALIAGYGARGRARRILMETLFAQGGSEDMARPVSEVANVLTAHGANIFAGQQRALSPIALWVLTRAIDSVIRTATYDNVAFLEAKEFEDEVAHLITRYVAAS